MLDGMEAKEVSSIRPHHLYHVLVQFQDLHTHNYEFVSPHSHSTSTYTIPNITEEGSDHLPAAFASWIQDQMDTSITPMTSHRQFYRRRANTPVPGSFQMGGVMDPCTSPSRWRAVSLGEKEWGSKVLEPIGNTSWYKVTVLGQLRTLVD